MSIRHYFYLDREQLSALLSTSELTLCERRNRWVPVVVHEVGSVGLKFLPIVFCGPTAAEYDREELQTYRSYLMNNDRYPSVAPLTQSQLACR